VTCGQVQLLSGYSSGDTHLGNFITDNVTYGEGIVSNGYTGYTPYCAAHFQAQRDRECQLLRQFELD
jgi:hypothetical protein